MNKYTSRFQTLTTNAAQRLAKNFASPVYLIDAEGITRRLMEFQETAKQIYKHSIVALSYKTNPLHGMLNILHAKGAYAEVVSGDEFRIAKKLGVKNSNIIFNGPMKTDQELYEAIESGAYINCDHADEIERIENIAKQMQRCVPIGIRLCFVSEKHNWQRFGFAVNQDRQQKNNAYKIVDYILQSPYIQLAGLHAHIGTNIRDINQFAKLGENMATFATELLEKCNLEMSWIDVGGGLAGVSPRIDEKQFSPHPIPDLKQYLNAVISPLLPYLQRLSNPATLFFEPGRTLFEPFGALLTRIIGSRAIDKNHCGFICDAGYNILATSHVYNHPLHIPGPKWGNQLTTFYGPTCNQVDQLHEAMELPSLTMNDLILFYGVGAYCMSFSYSFIRYRPGVLLWHHDDQAEWLRYPESLEHASQLEVVPVINRAIEYV